MSKNNFSMHEKTITVEWGDMDALGHVNNSRYFDYFQQARIEWLEQFNLDLKQKQGPVVVFISCTYKKPVVYPAQLTVISKVHSMGRSSMVMDHHLYQNEELMTEGTSKIVWVDYTTNKSIPLPEKIRCIAAD